MKKYTSLTSLHPKEMTNCIMKVSPNPYYDFEDKAGLMEINNNLFKKVFEKANQNDLKILDEVCYRFLYDEKMEVYYFDISFPNENAGEIVKMEEQLYRFGNLYKQVKFRNYIKPHNKDLFGETTYFLEFNTLKGMSKEWRNSSIRFK